MAFYKTKSDYENESERLGCKQIHSIVDGRIERPKENCPNMSKMFLLTLADGRKLMLLAYSEEDVSDWCNCIKNNQDEATKKTSEGLFKANIIIFMCTLNINKS